MEHKTLSLVCYDSGCMELYVIHDCTHVSTIQMAMTIQWDFILMMILIISMVVLIPWIFSYSLHHPDGCIHVVDSCLDLIYVYEYSSLICRSPDSVCPHPCKSS